jgi:Ca-activated chloride channel homolog
MKFIWPDALWLLLAVPALIGGYLYFLRRKKKVALRYAHLAMVQGAISAQRRFRRHVPPLLFLLAIITMIVATARPAALMTVPSQHESIILAMDVSGSMRATDVEPNRLAAAQAAAKAFVAEQPRSVRIGVVSFAATAALVQSPTHNREEVYAAIDRFQLQRGTAIGSGILVALAAILPNAGIDVSGATGREAARAPARLPFDEGARSGAAPAVSAEPGSYTSAAIILLTDGQRTTGPDPLDAARTAAKHGVRVFTVGVGTPDGEVLNFEGWRMRVRLDENTLRNVAEKTRGEYFYAGDAAELRKIYRSLSSRFVLEKKEIETTALLSGLAALFALLAAGLSLLWFNRIL